MRNDNEENKDSNTELSNNNSVNTSVNNSTLTNNIENNYVYKIELTANYLEYDLFIDAKTGDVINVRVDN